MKSLMVTDLPNTRSASGERKHHTTYQRESLQPLPLTIFFIATQAGLTAKSDKNYLKNRFYWSLPLKMMVGPEEAFERQVSGICTTQKKRPPLLEAALARPLDDLLVCF